MFVVLRTTGDPAGLARTAQAAVWDVDRDQPVTSVRTLEQLLARSEANRRFTALLLGIFAAVALTLAAIGVYGVIAYSTAQRTREIGIRVALGAARRDVMVMVLRDGVVVAGAGVALGIAAAAALTRSLAGLLFGVAPRDPLTFAAAAVVLLAVAVAATYLPARRAIRVEPMTALRAE
jgi:ABC-type antimicrobial peptide transport system permease subunit